MKNNWSTVGFGKDVSPEMVRDEFLETEAVVLLQGTNLFGNPVFSYVKVLGKGLKEMFGKMQKGENFKPSDFGTVLSAGAGVPSAEIRAEMKEQYNMVDVPIQKPPAPLIQNLQPKFFGDENT